MFLLGAIIRFGRFVLIFLIIVIFIWLLWRGISFVIRLLYDQIEDETSDWKKWLKSKLPKRKIKSNTAFDLSKLSNEELHELAKMIALLEDDERIE